MNAWLALLIVAAAAVALDGALLVLGWMLARRRERADSVRDEDLVTLDGLQTLFDRRR